MRIIYITTSCPFGCGESFLAPEIEEIRRQGHDLLVIPMRPGGRAASDHASHIPLSIHEPILGPSLLCHAAIATIRRPLQVLSIAYSLIRYGKISCRVKNAIVLPKALWLAQTASLWGADHIHAHWAGCTASMAWAASRFSGIPWSFTAHRWDILENNAFEAKADDASFVRLISVDAGRICASLGISIPPGKAKVLHLGVPLPPKINIPARTHPRLVGLCPAHLIPRKGQRYLVEALRIVTDVGLDVEIWLAGQGEDRVSLQEEARLLGVGKRIRFLGQVPHSDLLRMYENGSCDFVVLPSLHEGIPASLIEAMSHGIPVIATAVGGTPELVEGAGILVRPADSSGLAGAIIQLCQDRKSINLYGELGRKRVESEFAVKVIAAEIVRTMTLGQCSHKEDVTKSKREPVKCE